MNNDIVRRMSLNTLTMAGDDDTSKDNNSANIDSNTHIRTASMETSHKNSIIPNLTQRKPFIHSFMKANPTIGNNMFINDNMVNSKSATQQPASMSHFFRSFRSFGGGSNSIRTNTPTQEGIYSLETDLENILRDFYAKSRHGSFTHPKTQIGYTEHTDNNQQNTTTSLSRRPLRQSLTDIFNVNPIPTDIVDESFAGEESHINITLSKIIDTLAKQKVNTELPFLGEIMAILSVPFDKRHIDEQECIHALDVFDYIKNRFYLPDPAENFERVIFCSRLLGSGNLNLKLRVFSILENLLLEFSDEDSLPSSPLAFQSFVYNLTNALAQLTTQKDREQDDIIYLRTGVLKMLDSLSYGALIQLKGKAWDDYYTKTSNDKIPISVARLCLVETLCKSLMGGTINQTDPYSGVVESINNNCIERARDILVIEELFPRYWMEPGDETKPAYLKIIFLISELACETFTTATIYDLLSKTSTTSLLLPLVVEKLSPSKLKYLLAERETDLAQKMVSYNIVTMLIYLLSICSLEENPKKRTSTPYSPNLSLKMSVGDSDQISIFSCDLPKAGMTQSMILTLKGYILEFWNAGYKDIILQVTASMHQDSTGERVACAYENLVFHINDSMGEEIAKKTLPSLFKRLTNTYPPCIPALTNMLVNLSKRFKLYFYKPVMKCVASDDEAKVTKLLSVITCLRRYMSAVQFWMQDPEMISLVLLSNVGSSSSSSDTEPQIKTNERHYEPRWGTTTLGQCVVATEFLWAIKELRSRNPKRNLEEDEIAKKFLIDLERRVSIFLTAKEKFVLTPIPLRVILCNIFLDLRFFCGTTHRPGWLTCAIDWAVQPIVPSPQPFNLAQKEDAPPSNSKEPKILWLYSTDFEIVNVEFTRIKRVYLTVVTELQYETLDSNGHKHHRGSIVDPPKNTDILSEEVPRHMRHEAISKMYPISRNSTLDLDLDPPLISENIKEIDNIGPASRIAKYRYYHINEVNQDVFGSILSLLAAAFATLSNTEFRRLARPLWEQFIDDRRPLSFLPASFLFLECAEKIPKTVIEISTHDFYSGDPLRRFSVIQKHYLLSAFRFNALNQEFIHISSRKRPFRGEGGAFSTPFVPTDLGSNQFAFDEPRWINKLKNAGNFPPELKSQIQELGWINDNNAEENEVLKKVLTPLALLPSLFLEEEEEGEEEEGMHKVETAKHGKHGKKMISIGRIINQRKRIATIISMTISFMSMVDLLNDSYGCASNALHEVLEYFLRDDPVLFLRPFLNDLGTFKAKRYRDIFTRIRYLVNIQHKLPPGFTHVLFNHLVGMLKWMTKEPKYKDQALTLTTLIHPILSQLIFSSNELSLRDLRKSKVEHILISTGSFWFTHEQPIDMFPRGPSSNNTPFSLLNIQIDVFLVAMLRISHIQFLTNYLVRYPREVYAVKKTLQDYESILSGNNKKQYRWSLDESYFPDLSHRKRRNSTIYLYDNEDTQGKSIPKVAPLQQQTDTEGITVLRARIWLKFIDTLLYGLNKNYNDRDELERIFEGINTILCEHSRDFSLIGQALTLFTRVVTRLKRLFMSNRGYTLFLPVLFKVFCEVDHFPEIRSAIQFSWCRFYAVHEESFIFQMLGALVPIILNAFKRSEDLGIWMINSLFVLMEAMNTPLDNKTIDLLGIRLQVEIDDHERTILEQIDVASNTMAIPLSTNLFNPFKKFVNSPINHHMAINDYTNRLYPIENFVKLFITIISYDPGSIRAEQFVKIFRYLLPQFYRKASLKPLIEEGMNALIDVFSRFTNHSLFNDEKLNFSRESVHNAYGRQWPPNDRLTCKKEFIQLVQTYFKQNGVLTDMYHEKMAMVIKHVLRDYSFLKGIVCPTDWIKEYLEDCIYGIADIVNYSKTLQKMLIQITAQYRIQWKNVDGSDLLHGLAVLLEQSQSTMAIMNELASWLKEKYIPFGLTVATRHDWGTNKGGQKKFCDGLVHLIIAILENSTQDVIADIENQKHTVRLMSDIIIPLCLYYYLPLEYIDTKNQFRPDPATIWIRLLAYTSNIFGQSSSLLRNKSSSFSFAQHLKSHQANCQDAFDVFEIQELRKEITPRTMALLFGFCFVTIKIILIRGASTFDSLMGSWIQVAYFIKNIIISGQQHRSHGNLNFDTCLFDFFSWRFLEFVVQQGRGPLYVLLVDFIYDTLSTQAIFPAYYSPSQVSPSSTSQSKSKKTRWKSWAGPSPASSSSSSSSSINFQKQQQQSPSALFSEEIYLHHLQIDSIVYIQVKMGFKPTFISMERRTSALSRIKDEWQIYIRLNEV